MEDEVTSTSECSTRSTTPLQQLVCYMYMEIIGEVIEGFFLSIVLYFFLYFVL